MVFSHTLVLSIAITDKILIEKIQYKTNKGQKLSDSVLKKLGQKYSDFCSLFRGNENYTISDWVQKKDRAIFKSVACL